MIKSSTCSPLGAVLVDRLPGYLSNLTGALEAEANFDENDKLLIRTYLGEVRIGLELIAPHIASGQRVLEIGSGIGALGGFLKSQGVDILGIEPSGDGFGKMEIFAAWVNAQTKTEYSFQSINKTCEDLSCETDGTFDLIYSVHVLEHIATLDQAFSGMTKVMKPDGMMVHICPNYNFPYEPHFSFPVIFWSRRITKFVFKARIKKASALWNSLNFISTGNIKSLAKKNALKLTFKKGTMADYFMRLLNDPVFSERHNGLAAKFATILAKSPLIKILAKAPPEITSPVSFILRK